MYIYFFLHIIVFTCYNYIKVNDLKEKKSKKQILENYIIQEIRNGNLKVGDKIPSEIELAEKFGFSRQTVHATLANLALTGFIVRTPGKGSFISNRPVNRNIKKKMSFSDDMRNIGLTPGSRLIGFELLRGKDNLKIAKELNIKASDYMYFITRLRTGDNTPIAIQYTYMPQRFIPNFNLGALDGSLDIYLKECGYTIVGFNTRLKALEGKKEELELLQTSSKALLCSTSIRYVNIKNTSVPIQYTVSLYRSDIYEYTFSSF